MFGRIRSSNRVTAASLGAAVAGIILYVLSTYVFQGNVPTEISTGVPVIAAYVAGILVPHEPRNNGSDEAPVEDSH